MGDVSTWTKWQIIDACAVSGLVIMCAVLASWWLWIGLDILRGATEGRIRRYDGDRR